MVTVHADSIKVNPNLIHLNRLRRSTLFLFLTDTFIYLVVQHVGSYFPEQGSNVHPLYWKLGILTLDHQQSLKDPHFLIYICSGVTVWLSPLPHSTQPLSEMAFFSL